MHFDWQFFWKSLVTPSGPFLNGLTLTIVISVVAMILATALGLIIALMRRSRFTAVRWCASVYIWVIRGTPLLVQLVLIYTGLAAVGLYQFHDVSLVGFSVKAAVQAAILGLMINESAYIAEIIRAGLDSVAKGQFEAAASLGMKPGKVMRWIIVPQVLELTRTGTIVLLTLANTAIVIVPCVFIARLRSELSMAQQRQLVQAWHFRRLGADLVGARPAG